MSCDNSGGGGGGGDRGWWCDGVQKWDSLWRWLVLLLAMVGVMRYNPSFSPKAALGFLCSSSSDLCLSQEEQLPEVLFPMAGASVVTSS